jgi:hypothetical protein|tara:strand:+ start:54 stop:290 length:237 start_codon:yes stop_codon:yes gene_type:complete
LESASGGAVLECLEPIKAVPALVKCFADEFPGGVVTDLNVRPETKVALRNFYATQKTPFGTVIADFTCLPRERAYSNK